MSYADKERAGLQLASELTAMTPTSAEAMPNSGSATYVGYAAMRYDPGDDFDYYDDAIGDLRLNANFGNGTIGGTMTNWVGEGAGKINGQLAVTNGVIDGNTLAATANGTLSAQGRTATVSADLEGAFLGGSANALIGVMEGTIIHSDGYVGDVGGVFGARRK